VSAATIEVTITEGGLFMFISSPRSPNTKTRVVEGRSMQLCRSFVRQLCTDSLFTTEFVELLHARHNADAARVQRNPEAQFDMERQMNSSCGRRRLFA
jgi:hypothetical protein